MMVKVSRWALFGVIVSVIPILFSYVNLLIHKKQPTVGDIFSNGELLIVVGSMCAGAVGELIGSTAAYKIPKIVSSGATIAILFISALVFASIAEARLSGSPFDGHFIADISLWLFISALVSCGGCVVLSET